MAKVVLKLKRLVVKSYNSSKHAVDIDIEYLENDKVNKINKQFNVEESTLLFAKNFLNDLKKQSKVKYNLDFDEPFDNMVNVMFDEDEIGYTEERLAGGLNRIKERIRSFRSIKSYDNYINRFHDLSNYSIEFR